jgi:hypothetical protein
MTNTAERVQTPKGYGFITGRSSDGTVTVTLDNTRILAFPADQVAPLACADVKVGDVFLNIDKERTEVVEVSDRVIFFKDELAFRHPVQRGLLADLLADGTWEHYRPTAPATNRATNRAAGRVAPVSPAGGSFLLETYSNECHGRGPKMAFHNTSSAARALVKSGHLRQVGQGYFELSASGRVWAEAYQIAAGIAEVYRALLATEYTEQERRAYLGKLDGQRAELVKAIRLLFKVTVKQADRAISAIVHQGLSVGVAVRECRAAH